jgi:hypothetical protein
MSDRSNSASVRRQCARDILKLANVNNSATINAMADEFAEQLSENIQAQLEDFRNETIETIDAEEVAYEHDAN